MRKGLRRIVQCIWITLLVATVNPKSLVLADAFQASSDFSATQGNRNWYYLDSNGSYLTYDYANGRWQGSDQHALLWSNGGHPGDTTDVVRRWIAPSSGNVTVTGSVSDTDGSCGDGIVAQINKSGSIQWQSQVANGNYSGVSYNISFAVASGEPVDFVINRYGNNWCDSTYFDPYINFQSSVPANGSQFIAQVVPSSMTAGQSYPVSVTMENTGSSNWSYNSNHRLGSQNPRDNSNWGFLRIDMNPGETIVPGQQKTFSFTVTAPSAPGTYNFQWQMLQESVEWFGDLSTNVVVYVSGSTPLTGTISSSPNPCSLSSGTANCSTTLTWTSTGATNPCVFLKETGQMMVCGVAGSTTVDWINVNGYNFDLRASSSITSSLLSSVFAYGVVVPSSITASPNPCTLSSSTANCSTTLTWSGGGASNPCVFLRETGQLMQCGTTGSTTVNWINVNGYNFDLHSSSDISSVTLASIYVKGQVAASGARPLIGAIRWDAWTSMDWTSTNWNLTRDVGRWSNATLSPQQWRYRLPLDFGHAVDANNVWILENDAQVLEKEIQEAQGAIDYWAFVWYPGDIASDLLALYLGSANPAKPKFCAIINDGSTLANNMSNLANLFKNEKYVKVLGNRPLLYLLDVGTASQVQELQYAVRSLNNANPGLNLGDPYIVAQSWNAESAYALLNSIGADAIGSYSGYSEMRPPGCTISNPSNCTAYPYSELAISNENHWYAMADQNTNVVPTVSAGWDSRPRWSLPCPGVWDCTSYSAAYSPPTPQELADQLEAAIDWVASHSTVSNANTVLVYAWNELNEGAWLVPTYQEGTARLEAIKSRFGSSDATPPTVVITAPTNQSTVSGTVTVAAAASDNVCVRAVQFQLDGNNLGAEVTNAPYSVAWNTSNYTPGAHTLLAIVRDTAGNQRVSASVNVTIGNSNNPPYAASNPNPASGATYVSRSPIMIWTGGDPDAGNTVNYDVYFGRSSSPPLVSSFQGATNYTPGGLTSSTTYYWKIVARDNSGATTTGPVWSFKTGKR